MICGGNSQLEIDLRLAILMRADYLILYYDVI